MEVNIQQKNFFSELQLIQGIIEKRATSPILGHVLLEAEDNMLKLTATDLDIWFETKLPCLMVKEGIILVPAKKLFEVVRLLPDIEITLTETENTRLHIQCGVSEFNLAGLKAEDFPTLPELDLETGFTVQQNELFELIKNVIIAMHEEEGRFFIRGALLQVDESDGLTMVATDGHRLAYYRKNIEVKKKESVQKKFKVVVPKKALNELLRVLNPKSTDNVLFDTIGNYVYFYVEPRLMIARLLEESFPNYSETIEIDLDKKMILPREPFINAVRRVSTMANERLRGIELKFAENQLELIGRSPDLGDAAETVSCQYSGEVFRVGFNANYLLDFLSIADSEEISAEFRTVNKRAVFRQLKESPHDYRYVLMPMNVAEEELS